MGLSNTERTQQFSVVWHDGILDSFSIREKYFPSHFLKSVILNRLPQKHFPEAAYFLAALPMIKRIPRQFMSVQSSILGKESETFDTECLLYINCIKGFEIICVVGTQTALEKEYHQFQSDMAL